MMEDMNNKTAVVMSGGGGYGAYEVGVLKVLLGEKKIAPGIVTGTSAGAFNACARNTWSRSGCETWQADRGRTECTGFGRTRGIRRHGRRTWRTSPAASPGTFSDS